MGIAPGLVLYVAASAGLMDLSGSLSLWNFVITSDFTAVSRPRCWGEGGLVPVLWLLLLLFLLLLEGHRRGVPTVVSAWPLKRARKCRPEKTIPSNCESISLVSCFDGDLCAVLFWGGAALGGHLR